MLFPFGANMTQIIAFVNHKGGVGKTTSSLNLGKALSLIGKKILLIDIDPQANLTLCCGIEQAPQNMYHVFAEDMALPILHVAENIDLAPSSLELTTVSNKLHANIGGYFKLRKSLKDVSDKYDFVLIDCPPSLDILTMNAFIASENVLVVVQAHYLAVVGLKIILDVLLDIKENLDIDINILGFLLTQTSHTNISKAITENMQSIYQEKLFKTSIRQSVKFIEASAQHTNIFDYDANSTGALDYMALAKEIAH